MTEATANGNGAMSRGDTAMPRVRCGRDTGRSSIRDPGWARTPIKRDTMTLGKSRCTHPPRCTIISIKPKMEKTISTRRIETGGNQCYIGKFQIRGLSIILGQRERESRPEIHQDEKEETMTAGFMEISWKYKSSLDLKSKWRKTSFLAVYWILSHSFMDLKSKRSQGQ